MATAEVDDPAPAHVASHPPRHLPGFVELLARQASRLADGPGDPIEQGVADEAAAIVRRQPAVCSVRERRCDGHAVARIVRQKTAGMDLALRTACHLLTAFRSTSC
jgi:hypothetical protein